MNRLVFSEKLKLAFNETPKTKAFLANEINVSMRTIDYWCSGRSLPDIEQLHNIAQATNKSILWFYGMEPSESIQVQELQDKIKKLESERDSWRSQAELLRDLLKNQQNNQ